MNWIYLLIAGVFEISFALWLKFSEGFTKPCPTAGFIVFIVLSLYFFDKAPGKIPLGSAYAISRGIDAFGIAVISTAFLKELVDFRRIFF